jgi:hypothetical protein
MRLQFKADVGRISHYFSHHFFNFRISLDSPKYGWLTCQNETGSVGNRDLMSSSAVVDIKGPHLHL